MKLIRKTITFLLITQAVFAFWAMTAYANNLQVSNVTLGTRNTTSKTMVVQFNISWENSWRTSINHDAAWVTVRLADGLTNNNLCEMTASGLSPTGSSPGSSSNLEIYVPTDKKGAFIRPSSSKATGSVSSTGVQLTINYGSAGACSFSDSTLVTAQVFGTEMVFIPQGAFYAGDYSTLFEGISTFPFRQGSTDFDPWYISSEATFVATDITANGYYYVNAGYGNESATGASFTVPVTFPKGYQAMYCMKYEITEGQWVAFYSTLIDPDSQNNRDITNSNTGHKNTDDVLNRNTVSCDDELRTCTTLRPDRPVNHISFPDIAAFLDWAALRPMTELEFEKIARGPLVPVMNESAWGNTSYSIPGITSITPSLANETGAETMGSLTTNVNTGYRIWTSGDSRAGGIAAGQLGPLRAGIFARSSSTRETSGAGYYGVMDLSGSLMEPAVSVGFYEPGTGRFFRGAHGDGMLVKGGTKAYWGNANVSGWVQFNPTAARGITASVGVGSRGGDWYSSSTLPISARYHSPSFANQSSSQWGGRGVRTYDGP